MTDRIWITWEAHRRSRGLSAALDARLHEITWHGGRLRRYLCSAWRTFRILCKARGAVVFVQSPSIVLALLATAVGKFTAALVVVDAHNGGIDPLDGRSRFLTWLARLSLRMSDLVIVTNVGLARQVQQLGARTAILTDPIPDFPQTSGGEMRSDRTRILAICTWASDEPYLELIKAAPLLPPGCELAITGRPRLTREQLVALPSNVLLTGFISEAEYVGRLRTSDLIVDLTTRENCLLCGAYEAISVHKPLVVSDTGALRTLLDDAAIYCANDAQSIAAGMTAALGRLEELHECSRRRDAALRSQWMADRGELQGLLDQLAR